MKARLQHWMHWAVNLVIAVISGVILIPLLRKYPKTVHEFFSDLHGWQRNCFLFFLCLIFAYTMFKLFSPRLVHLKQIQFHPPTWSAWLAGLLGVAIIDVAVGLTPNGYVSSAKEWSWCFGGSLAVLCLCRWFTATPDQKSKKSSSAKKKTQRVDSVTKEVEAANEAETTNEVEATSASSPPTETVVPEPDSTDTQDDDVISIESIETAPWPVIEQWLTSESPAKYDLLGNRLVANRLSSLLVDGTQSIGIVGPFGSGKTSIVKWMIQNVEGYDKKNAGNLLFSEHSCWGFESSSASIHAMLASAIGKVEEIVDTFHVSSLPESYRQTFSAGGEWFDTISQIVLGKRNPVEQFESLSQLMKDINARLVFVVEDLDRNDTESFDIQEVLAFLHQLKDFKNLSFVLVGGLSSSIKIDFNKLCDHIEFIRSVETHRSSQLVTRVCEKCMDKSVFNYATLGEQDNPHAWNPLTGMMMRDYEEMSLPQAVASLLNTPRAMRHSLGRTFTGWRLLYGEIDLNQLLAVNVLRYGAPEAFLFLIRRWDRLHSLPSSDPAYGQHRIDHIRQAIASDWESTIQNVEWNPTAALMVMEFILPPIEWWIVDNTRNGTEGTSPQGVHHDRYWRRAVNESIEVTDVNDQDVIQDIRAWLENGTVESNLVAQLTSSELYSDMWEHLAGSFFGVDRDKVRQICEQVITRVAQIEVSSASSDSQGILATWRFANRRITHQRENKEWLKAVISIAALVSLELTLNIWRLYGNGTHNVLHPDDIEEVRQHKNQVIQATLVDGESFQRILDSKHPFSFYKLVFDPRESDEWNQAQIANWAWLSPIVMDALQRNYEEVAVGVASLISHRDSGVRRQPSRVDAEKLFMLFPDDAANQLVKLLSTFNNIDNEDNQTLINQIVTTAQEAIQQAVGQDGESGTIS